MSKSDHKPEMFIILNPHAAKGKALTHRATIDRYFTNKNIPFTMSLTERPFQAIELAREAVLSGYRTVVAAGGDGTVNEVVDGVVKASRELGLSFEGSPVVGLLPIGRGNDFAKVAGIPKDLDAACELLTSQSWKAIDYGELYGGRFPEGRCFINGVGIGFEPMVNFVASEFKRVSGMLSYLLGFVKILFHYPAPVNLSITTEQGSVSCSTQQISLCNGRRMGSVFIMAPEAELDDALLDIVYANRPIAGWEILRYAIKFLSGSQLRTERFSMIRAAEVVVSTDDGKESLVCHTDGEAVSRGCNSIKVILHPGALKLIRNL